MKKPSARRLVLEESLTGSAIRKVSRGVFPKRNDYVSDPALFEELLPELARFGVNNRGQLKRLLTRHRRALLADDRSRLAPHEERLYIEMYGAEHTKDAIRRQYWFGYPALVRNALESEFGDAAAVWADEKQACQPAI